MASPTHIAWNGADVHNRISVQYIWIAIALIALVGSARAHAQGTEEGYHRAATDQNVRTEEAQRTLVTGTFPIVMRSELSTWELHQIDHRAEIDLYLGRYQRAITTWQNLIEGAPGNTANVAQMHYNQGTAEFLRHNYEQTRLYMNEAIRDAAEETTNATEILGKGLYWIALSHLADRSQPLEKCADILRESLKANPHGEIAAEAYYLLGLMAEERGLYREAAQNYATTLQKAPNHWDEFAVRIRIIQCLIEQNDDAGTEAQLRQLQERSGSQQRPTSLVQERVEMNQYGFYLMLGEFELRHARYREAEAAFIKLTETSIPEYRRKGLIGLADTYHAAGANDSAAAIYQRLITENPNDGPGEQARYRQAKALLTLGQRDEATTLLTAIAAEPRNIRRDAATFDLATIHYQSGEYDRADSGYANVQVSTTTGSLRCRALIFQADIALRRDSAVKGLEYTDSALQNNAPYPDADKDARVARTLRAIALIRTNSAAEAVPILNELIATAHGSDSASALTYWLGEAYYQTKLYRGAIDLLESLVRTNPGSSYAEPSLYTIGWANLRQKKFAEAESAFVRLVKAYPATERTAEAELRRGDCLYALEKFSEAATAYHNASLLNTTPKGGEYADYLEGLALYRAAEYRTAHMALEKFVLCHSDSPIIADALYLDADCAYREAEYADAETRLIAIISGKGRAPIQQNALARLVDVYQGSHRTADALVAAAMVIESGGDARLVDRARKQREEILGRLRKHGDETASGQPGITATEERRIRSAMLERMNRPREAAGYEDNQAIADLLLARGAMLEGDSATGRQKTNDAATRINASNPSARTRLALAQNYNALGEPRIVVAVLDQLEAEHNPMELDPETRLAVAKLYRSANEPARALRLLSTRPDSLALGDDTSLFLAELYRSTGSAVRADSIYRKLNDRRGMVGECARLRLAQSSIARGELVEGRGELERLLSEGVWSSSVRGEAQYELASLYETQNDTRRSAGLLKHIVEERCNDIYATKAIAKLKTLKQDDQN